jgi:hypothetical protein
VHFHKEATFLQAMGDRGRDSGRDGGIRDGRKRDAYAAESRGGKVFVGNLKKWTSDRDVDQLKHLLLEQFKHYGEVLALWIARNPAGFAFVTYALLYNKMCA